MKPVGWLLLALALVAVPWSGFAAETSAPARQVYILYSFGREYAPFDIMAGTFRNELAERSPAPIEFHEAVLETARYQGVANEQPLVDYLQALFAKRPPDLIVTFGGPAGLFVNRHPELLMFHVSMIATVEQRRLKELGVSTNIAVVPIRLKLPGSVEDLLQLLPATTNIVVVLGATPFERYWTGQCRRAFARFTNHITFTYFNDLSLDSMVKRVAALPPHSAILYGPFVTDAAGVTYEKETALKALHASANAPIFGLFEQQLGLGIVGGRLFSNAAWGRRAADAALRILNGEPPGRIKPQVTEPGPPVYDWRELQRWHISEAQLPPGAEIRFYQPTLWEQYRWQIIAGITFCLFEAALIVVLLGQLSQRRRAEACSRQAELERQRTRDELAHVARLSTMGQLASTLAHELNQPLGAILRNTEAAELFLHKNPPDYEEVRAILTDIRQDDQRAGRVIDRMRSLLKRHDLQLEPLVLQELVDQVTMLLHPELEARQVTLHVELPPVLPPVLGDRVQLQQVLLNLLVNGAQATQDRPSGRRWLDLRACGAGNHDVEVSVSDTGHGIPADKLARIFEPFFSTKASGLGMGLAISQTIINAHGGRMWAENNPNGGAVVRFTLRVASDEGHVVSETYSPSAAGC